VADVAEALNNISAEVKSAADSIADSTEKIQASQAKLDAFVAEHPDISAARLTHLAALTDDVVMQLRKKITALNDAVVSSRGAYEQAMQQQATHLLAKPEALYESPDLTIDTLKTKVDSLEQQRTDFNSQVGALAEKLKANDEEMAKRRADQEACNAAKKVYDNWAQINELFGDKEGKKFRTIALSYVLNNLIRSANEYMSHLTDRYTLSVQPGTFIILVTDAYQGYTTRTANTISGGETFLVSLALALALSDLGSVSGIDVLFIDEGFGSLSGEPLQNAIETLRMLHSNSRRVGIISHVAELRERIPVQIQVTQSDRTAASKIKIVP
jgi:exonuclease SbcC